MVMIVRPDGWADICPDGLAIIPIAARRNGTRWVRATFIEVCLDEEGLVWFIGQDMLVTRKGARSCIVRGKGNPEAGGLRQSLTRRIRPLVNPWPTDLDSPR